MSTLRCPKCGNTDSSFQSRFCNLCGAALVDAQAKEEMIDAKHWELPFILSIYRGELIVRPGSEDSFIESRNKVLGARAVIVQSRATWIRNNVAMALYFSIVAVLLTAVMASVGLPWIGVAIGLLMFAAYSPHLVMFIWSLQPINDRNRYYGP